MTVLQIIFVVATILSFLLGYKAGSNDGYLKGRKAVRAYYEGIDKVRV
jgi:hypothetical protein